MTGALTACAAAVLAAAALAMPQLATALQRYGHAYQAPADFTDAQYAEIANAFPVFTVEKRHAYGVYGNASAPEGNPDRYNSIAATIGTARKIKAINASTKVLMYWNSCDHYSMYECEADVQPSWLLQPESGKKPVYNYSVPEFRAWWVKCAIDAFRQGNGAIDGFFFDAVPDVTLRGNPPNGDALWGAMVDEVRAGIGDSAFIIYNGFYVTGDGGASDQRLAGPDCLAHTDAVYVESLASLGDPNSRIALANRVPFLRWVAENAGAGPTAGKLVFGHGLAPPSATPAASAEFVFGLAVYLLVAADPDDSGWFLGNQGYNVDDGLLTPPHPLYGVRVGASAGPFTVDADGTTARRSFVAAEVVVDLKGQTATITTKP